jgi:hypothetical protein
MERPFPYLSNIAAIKISTIDLYSTKSKPSQINIYQLSFPFLLLLIPTQGSGLVKVKFKAES